MNVTAITEGPATLQRATEFLWLDLTRKCQLACTHCYNGSGSHGDHGSMTRADWFRVVQQAAETGIRRVQLIGGEPTLHPDALDLVSHALGCGLAVEVYSNGVHLSEKWWTTLLRPGVSLATSYYSDDPAEHTAITGRRTHALTRANIVKAVRLGVPVRVGVVEVLDGQRVDEARRELRALGVTRIVVDHTRPFGRAAEARSRTAPGSAADAAPSGLRSPRTEP